MNRFCPLPGPSQLSTRYGPWALVCRHAGHTSQGSGQTFLDQARALVSVCRHTGHSRYQRRTYLESPSPRASPPGTSEGLVDPILLGGISLQPVDRVGAVLTHDSQHCT